MNRRYAYLHARLSLMVERLLPLERLERFIVQPPEEKESTTAVNSAAELLEAQAIPIDKAAHLLMDDLLADFMVLLRPLSGAERDFLLYWIRKYDIANIKAIIRGRIVGLSAEAIRSEMVNLEPFANLPVEDLLRAEDTAEMLRQLESIAPYREATQHARQVYENKQELFLLEAALDYRYVQGLWRRAKAVAKNERAQTTSIVGILIERHNLMWLLRYRFNYHLSAPEVFYLLNADIPRALIQQDWYTVAQLSSVEQVIAALAPVLQQRLTKSPTIFALEQLLEEVVQEKASEVFRHSPSVVARIFAYVLLRECQMQRLLAIIKGRQFGFSPPLIRQGANLKPR